MVLSSSRLLKETPTANRIVPPIQLNFVKIKENIERCPLKKGYRSDQKLNDQLIVKAVSEESNK